MATKHSPAFEKLCEAARGRVTEVSADLLTKRLQAGEPFVLIDVREDHEWDQGHLPKAVHLGRGILERDIEVAYPDSRTEIVLYCGGGYRSALAAESIGKMGYTNVKSLSGGFRGWVERGLAVTGGKK